MAFGRKRSEHKGNGSAARSSAIGLFLPGAALGLVVFVLQGAAFDDGATPVSVGAVMASRLFADAVVGIVGLCAAYIAFYAIRWSLAQTWGWIRANLLRRGPRP